MRTPPAPICVACVTGSHDICRGCLCDHNDPTVMAAQSLAETMAYFRAMLPDQVYREALISFERLVAMLPVPVASPVDR